LNRYFFSSSVLGDSIGQIRTTNGLGTNSAGVRSLPGLVSHIVEVKSYFTQSPAQVRIPDEADQRSGVMSITIPG
jgi:hypothetical protein